MRTSVSTTAMQVASRILLVWGVVDAFPYLGKSFAYSSMLFAWSVTEVIRYSYFTFNLSGYSPSILTWLRYNTFFVLYPIGISSECWLIYRAVEPARTIRSEFAWILMFSLVGYVPGMFSMLLGNDKANCNRCLYPVHPHDASKKKGYEREASPKDSISRELRRKEDNDESSIIFPLLLGL